MNVHAAVAGEVQTDAAHNPWEWMAFLNGGNFGKTNFKFIMNKEKTPADFQTGVPHPKERAHPGKKMPPGRQVEPFPRSAKVPGITADFDFCFHDKP